MDVFSGTSGYADVWVVFFLMTATRAKSLRFVFWRTTDSWREDWMNLVNGHNKGDLIYSDGIPNGRHLKHVDEVSTEELFSGMRLGIHDSSVDHNFDFYQEETVDLENVLAPVLYKLVSEPCTFSVTPLNPGPILQSQRRRLMEAITRHRNASINTEPAPWNI